MRRREFIILLGGATTPLASVAEVLPSRKVVVWLSGVTKAVSRPNIESFLRGMQDLGYSEGRNFEMVYRFSDGYEDRIPAQTEEAVQLKPDVILATAIISAVAARKLTSTIPIVCAALADAVHLGLVASEARPGGNVTGVEPYVAGLPAKQMEIAREIIPSATVIGLLTNLSDPKAPPQVQELKAAAKDLGVQIVSADANSPDDIEKAMQTLASAGVGVTIVLQSSMLFREKQRIAELALEKHLPTVYGYQEHVESGGLISYGVDLRWCYYRSAYFVDKILRGTRPGDLPVEFPTKLVLAINVKTAKALGIIVPPSLLATADEVIE
jgi:putative tryptophan/tyrosine transport system substrate-binding protein